MKVIELKTGHLTLDELMGLAKDELVVIRKPDGSVLPFHRWTTSMWKCSC